mgnify:CR=1 FL=1
MAWVATVTRRSSVIALTNGATSKPVPPTNIVAKDETIPIPIKISHEHVGFRFFSKKVFKRAKMNSKDIDLFEVNEAFAAVVLRYLEALNISEDKVNVNGGSIAMGHPLGATGSMLLGTLLDELERRDLNTGLVTLCVGAGMGTATIIERV